MSPAALVFEWSNRKAALNLRRHQVAFTEAESCFDDDHALIVPDELHSDDEPREILIGFSRRGRLLFVSFVQRAPHRMRIISARRVNQKERHAYEEKQR